MTESASSLKVGGRECVPKAAALFAKAFEHDPVLTYFLHTIPEAKRLAYMPEYFHTLLTAAALNDGTFTEIGDFKSCVAMLPPGKKVDNLGTIFQAGLLGMMWNAGLSACHKMLIEFPPAIDRCKKKGLRGFTKYHYVFFVATDSTARGQGLCPKLLKHWQEVGNKDKVPVWIEATTAKSMRVYERCGFEHVEHLMLGKGKVGADGLPPKKGTPKQEQDLGGVPFWTMIYWPEGVKPKDE